jgi:hypothetical protein
MEQRSTQTVLVVTIPWIDKNCATFYLPYNGDLFNKYSRADLYASTVV